MKSRESRIRKRKKRVSDVGSESEDDLDAITGPLLGEFSIYIQDRPNIKPSALVLKHLAWSAGAQIVDKRWKSERLKKKEVNDGLDADIEQKRAETANQSRSAKKKSKAKRRKNENENESESEEEEEGDEDSDIGEKRKRDKKKKKRQRITPLRSRNNRNRNKNSEEESDGDEDGDGDVEVVKKKRQTKLRKFRLIISHPARYKYLKLKKNNRIAVVGQSWLFQSIEHYKVADVDEYIVEPNKQPSRSPVH